MSKNTHFNSGYFYPQNSVFGIVRRPVYQKGYNILYFTIVKKCFITARWESCTVVMLPPYDYNSQRVCCAGISILW